MAVNREVEEIASDLSYTLRLKQHEELLFKAAIELAYRVGQRDGYKEAQDDLVG